ncbi:MAG: hypothetical protein H7195_06685 [Chryseobacterium sp.]|nr:hypothetical protein [Chryseobacterium sp.]
MKIKTNKIQILGLIIIMVVILFCSLVALQNPGKYTYFLFRSKIIVFFLAVLGILLSIYVITYYSKILFKKEYFGTNREGIYNGCSYLKEKQINWHEIVELNEIKYQGISRIRVKVIDNKKYLKNLNFMTKYIADRTIKDLGTPIIIDSANLDCTFDEIKKLIFDNWKKNKTN